jgi:ubiquinone/menaquinone biosynthesis C-methylase UbiE
MSDSGREDVVIGGDLSVDKMPAHWLMARLGKRVLRPGGIETTRWLLDHVKIGASDDVVELAPGLGITAREVLSRAPRSYAGVERDEAAAELAGRAIARTGFPGARILVGDASAIPLPSASASVVIGEAMLSMQTPEKKARIFAEAHRVLRPGGRYGIHELAVNPDDVDRERFEEIQSDLSRTIHVGVRIGTASEWKAMLAQAGFEIEAGTSAPMRLLEPDRMVRDEGLWRTLRFLLNALRTPGAAARLRSVRGVFRKHRAHLCAVALVARRRS